MSPEESLGEDSCGNEHIQILKGLSIHSVIGEVDVERGSNDSGIWLKSYAELWGASTVKDITHEEITHSRRKS